MALVAIGDARRAQDRVHLFAVGTPQDDVGLGLAAPVLDRVQVSLGDLGRGAGKAAAGFGGRFPGLGQVQVDLFRFRVDRHGRGSGRRHAVFVVGRGVSASGHSTACQRLTTAVALLSSRHILPGNAAVSLVTNGRPDARAPPATPPH